MSEPVRVGRTRSQKDNQVLREIKKLFRKAATMEAGTRPKRRRLTRRFIGVNVIYNRHWRLFTDYIASNINPFCAQVLAGPVRNVGKLQKAMIDLRQRLEPAL